MARRSARLQKRSPTPEASSGSNSSWATAESERSPERERLPSVVESDELVSPIPHDGSAENHGPTSHLPQPTTAATPLKTKSSMSFLNPFTTRTPKNRTPIKPSGDEMHPAHHHPSTAAKLDEARWLGFQALGSYTAPPKASDGLGLGQVTPSKSQLPTSTSKPSVANPSPNFRFRFRSPISGLTPKSSRILREIHDEDAVAGGRAIFGADEFSAPADISPERKVAVPKGKASRFSDVHMKEFKKMDSIMNHPSAFRALKPLVHTSLKRSGSKAELDKPDAAVKASSTSLKRTQSKLDVTETPKKIVPASLKRTQSKMDVGQPSNLSRSQSTVRLVPPTRDGRPPTRDGNPAAKRVKRTQEDDAASTRPVSRDSHDETPARQPATPRRMLHSQTGLPRPRSTSRLMTPTKASLARSQSVKTLKSTSIIPSLLRSPSARAMFSPTNIGGTMVEGMKEGFRKTSDSLHRVKSILRTGSPSRKFSDDPEKVAAGTHMSPPQLPSVGIHKALPEIPATAPVKKHVNFTTSTLEKAAHDELGKSPSPMKFRAGSEMPAGAVVYPVLQSAGGVDYPLLPAGDESPIGSPSRRLTFGGSGVQSNVPGSFNFESDKPINFGPASIGTIRMVRKSDASSLMADRKGKRKLETFEETSGSDKENREPPAEEEQRSSKKARVTVTEMPKTPKPESKLPRKTPKHTLSQILLRLQQALQQTTLSDLTDFVTSPRLDNPTHLTTLVVVLATVFLTMSWFGRGMGRFSPFGRPGNSNAEVSDSDFSYITNEDLAAHAGKGRNRSSSRAAAPEIVDWDDKNPDRDTDVLVFKQGKLNFPTHFPAQSIQDGDLKIGTVRQAAAKKMGVNDPRRIRMFFKGRNLKHDERTAREEGLRGDGSGSEILCVLGEAHVGSMAPGSVESGIPGTAQRAWSDDEDEEDDTEGGTDSGSGIMGKKKPRKRGGKKSKKGKKAGDGTATGSSTPGYSTVDPRAEFLPIPAHLGGPRPTSAPPANPPRPTVPQTPIGKLDAIASKFHTEFVPLCVQYMNHPPEEKSKRDFEYKKLSESILTQILMKFDGVETDGDQDARARRRELVKEVQAMLNRLDEVHMNA
ncbi:hypothetical protein BCR34DRAFT_536864 [Clohesyomyces aquaticus]|uniref:BAG domain-containing protein n=1 Tax=Clohesyomyces aquaticus TaxID=1231657 RepID=A0A1Y1ZQL4_9PLEO|nr:hypothetical protein BCR34DRAFT_536864 [Clohesyomyces aquaticus]